jgi:ribosome recycling factor
MDIGIYKQQMQKAIAFFEKELQALQIGRASAGLVENIEVNLSYGGSLKIPQVGHVTIMDAQTIKIETWDKAELKNVEKAIYDANCGLTPKNEGSYIMIKIPALTQERRGEITKQVKAMGEEIKARIRLIRQDAMKDTKKQFDDKLIGEDAHKANEKEIDVLVKSMNDTIDSIVKIKSEDVMKV